MAYNESHVCDVAPEPNQGEGPCGGAARRSAAEPEAPASGADAHTSCYGQLRQRIGLLSFQL